MKEEKSWSLGLVSEDKLRLFFLQRPGSTAVSPGSSSSWLGGGSYSLLSLSSPGNEVLMYNMARGCWLEVAVVST